jgi:hypothetical protein
MAKRLTLCMVLWWSLAADAGGPAYVAGASYFQSSAMGTPLTWSGGAINYFTDRGDLSAILPGPSADSFVASAFSLWTSIPTAAIVASHSGQLAEDVTGSNITVVNGAITSPADITPGALSTPVGIVYDEDGSVTDALLGSGAGNAGYCQDNGVFGGIDNLGTNAQFLHALIIMNGNCAQTSAQLPDLQYHLARVIGRVLGLDWSQANLNVITRNPQPTSDEFAGFPVMHEIDPPSCVPVAVCYSNNGTVNPAQPKMDDEAALSRLYPVTAQNVGNFPGKQIFAQATARTHGSVYFTDANGNATRPMQGVNVVARWIDPSTNMPSGSAVVSSISGHLFCGNAGNIVSGYTDSTGLKFNRFGSSDASLEGFFDLAGLQIPNGATSAQYLLTVEAVDPMWSTHAGPYGATSQVEPSGSAQPILVTVTLGSDSAQDILMQGSAAATPPWYGATSYAHPAPLPASGSWAGALNSYGDADFFQFSAQANRTLSVVTNAIGSSGNPSESKLEPVIGMWALADPGESPAPANTPSAFNTAFFGESRLDAQILQSTTFRLGVTDYRGDGRPDYLYSARLLYGDNLTPARASVAGGTPLTIAGLGFEANTAVKAASLDAPVLAATATRLLVNSAAVPDGRYDVILEDTASGAQSDMIGVLTIGAGPNDTIKRISGSNPGTPVGGEAPVPFAVQVVAPDGVTPVAGASVAFSSSPGMNLSACSGASSCTVLTDQSGGASTYISVPLDPALANTVVNLTASLAPASYSNPKQVQATLLVTASSLDLSLTSLSVWVAQGATVTLPIAARVMSNGNAVSGATLNYQITAGSGGLSSTTAQSDANGNASVSLQVSSMSNLVRVTVCVGPNNSPCQIFTATAVQPASIQLEAVSGTLQLVESGQSFQSVVVRAVDSQIPPHNVIAASIAFVDYIGRMPGNEPIIWDNEGGISSPTMPIILGESQGAAQSDANGLATFALSPDGVSGNVALVGSATAGDATVTFEAQQLGP